METVMEDRRLDVDVPSGSIDPHDLASAARCHLPVLISGDHEADARAIANAIHGRSFRRVQPFVAVNCMEMPDADLASRLFGRPARRDDGTDDGRGLLELAHRGTIFMAHIDAMGVKLQERLLRFLERGEVRRSDLDRAPARLDVRFITFAGPNLFAQRVGVSFRPDLFYRLNTIHLILPRQ